MNKQSILNMSEILPRYGVTSFIPTIYSSIEPELIKAIKAVVGAMGKEKGANILGMHLEGPFISHERLGAQSPESVVPVDIKLMDRLISAAKGHIINMTVAPELKDMRRLALHCIAKNIILQAGRNWCIWCLRFNNFVQTTPELKEIVDKSYLYYHLNYSPENKNEKVFSKYGNPGEKFGYPVFIVFLKFFFVLKYFIIYLFHSSFHHEHFNEIYHPNH